MQLQIHHLAADWHWKMLPWALNLPSANEHQAFPFPYAAPAPILNTRWTFSHQEWGSVITDRVSIFSVFPKPQCGSHTIFCWPNHARQVTRPSLQIVQTRLLGPPVIPSLHKVKLASSKPTNLNPGPQLGLCPTGNIILLSRFLEYFGEYKSLDVIFSSLWCWKIVWTFLAGI